MKNTSVSIKKIKDIIFFCLSGNTETDLTTLTAPFVQERLTTDIKKVVLDLEEVTRFYSASISRLVEILRTVEKQGSVLYLVNVPAAVSKVLSMANIANKFTIYESEYEFILDHGLEEEFFEKKPDARENREALRISLVKNGDNHVIRIEGSMIEEPQHNLLIEEVKLALAQSAKSIIIDFEKTIFIDSLSVGKLMVAYKMCDENGVRIRAINANDVVKDVLMLTQIGTLYGIER
ncbi:MAG: hypothetical protein A2268_11620 [Candidatus Raymondbacteria bacterium RifOxyA12_full_50_37]|uniref:STAS domain-containing protein n=1 Tax=Candidatus Raymondbacteria bacterium RIFOXYD12_FULL_49_13 TaxID=1817890 RepID=A0A1F7F3C2_UNCRA|nr:MAG: hypothetical protein A2268_11620 [Candidatus Raymondbacteria bacterium RifOxyA12_full_50_37]OGJ85986.1 MAG: hypothetical protein A2248_00455 [Candidatus Raymondbacteria bacterium RIFOXYA2_FULL_49_16]OGJ90092.1 MAG: hypothetical protein A2350_07995 [Candidatus Raymondbacteria bacterium RifOxyB12_full_50_8]OGJ97132.1 MAG: hypothetical protein A2453_12465 [Candidatus Raymondbacteria bacterium RIFOXYC2_FULL_50_21]OGK01165.1 MAG: hypothetical protein A2519_01430 [Candidatus Raymondbacteria b